MPVIAANRVGREKVEPCEENGGQSSSLSFYGSSFITDNTGGIIAEANRTDETILTASFDLERLEKDRLSWGLFRDRRPEMYQDIVK
jgi:N-carbamoylputrescine amidase